MFKTNEYFDGKVKSIAFTSENGPATVGVMAPGEYTFGTSSIERMTLISGNMKAKLPGASEFKNIQVLKANSYPSLTTFARGHRGTQRCGGDRDSSVVSVSSNERSEWVVIIFRLRILFNPVTP